MTSAATLPVGAVLSGGGAAGADADFARRAVLRLSAIEFWERYSFYNMFALLALFVAAPVASGGMGWTGGQALRFFGVYLLAVQLAPLAGGFAIDRWIGARTALRIGAAGLVVGHGLLAAAAFLPSLAGLRPQLAALKGSLGGLALPPALPAGSATSYLSTSAAFYGAVALVAIGNGLFKPVLTVVVGRLPHGSATAREAAFTTFFLFINIGGLMSTLLGGWLAQAFGWGWAFAAAASGMLFALATMALVDRRYVKPYIGTQPLQTETVAAPASTGRTARPVLAAAVVLLTVVLFCVPSYQSYGFVSLFTDTLVDRHIGGFVIPPAWFTALNPIAIMVLTPVLLRMWRGGGPGHDWSVTDKMAAGFVLTALAFLALAAASMQARGGHLANPLWIMLALVIIAATELLTTPATMSAMTRLAPRHRQTLALGCYSAAVGLGAWLSGRVGALALEADTTIILTVIAGVALAVAILIMLFRKRLARLAI